MPLYMKKSADGLTVEGVPQARPIRVDAVIDGDTYRATACAGWSDAALEAYAGWIAVDPASPYDPAVHNATGGGAISGGGLALPAHADRSLETIKAEALAKVDAEAETARLQFISGGAGMALVYERKRDEAEAYLAAVTPDPADYPLLKARAERLDPITPDYAAVAADWNARAAAWVTAAAAIEDLREGAKETIAAAADAAAVEAATAITWPTPA